MFKLVVLSCLLACSTAQYFAGYAPLPYAYGAYPYSYYGGNYRGPLSLAPGQPANVLGADGRPLDTLDVNLDRAKHYATKALDGSGVHLLKKRSAPALAVAAPGLAYAAYPAATHAAPLAYSYSPLSYGYSHYSPLAYSAYTPYLHHY